MRYQAVGTVSFLNDSLRGLGPGKFDIGPSLPDRTRGGRTNPGLCSR